uniref:Transcription factor 19 n=1 Tax=Cynoglossus semilaevis TaxID=244447 RepID=A0A3P8WXE3_CYNSE
MLKITPCFQLLRIGPAGGDASRDLYTFRPGLSRCMFRLGRAAEVCDVTLNSTVVSRIHAELHVEREGSGDQEEASQEEGTWVNEVRLQAGILWELSDGDTLTFGGQTGPGSPEFYFLFQKVKVRPLDFDAITIPKVNPCPGHSLTGAWFCRIRTNSDQKVETNLDLSRLSLNRATVILSSIGSLSKMKGSAWTFKRSHSHEGPPSAPAAPTPKTLQSTSRSRRKSAHTVLLEDDSSDEPRSKGGEEQRSVFTYDVLIKKVSKVSQYIVSLGSAVGSVEPCAAPRCRLPQQDTVQWIQCDVCDAWFHIDCLHVDRKKILTDPNADFHCGCR